MPLPIELLAVRKNRSVVTEFLWSLISVYEEDNVCEATSYMACTRLFISCGLAWLFDAVTGLTRIQCSVVFLLFVQDHFCPLRVNNGVPISSGLLGC